MKIYTAAMVQGLALACAVSMFTMASAATTAAGTTVGTQIDDSVVTARVKSALLSDHDVKSFDIKVETRKGQVQLSGFVDTQARIDNAIALTRKVQGVTGVENGMTVKTGSATLGNTVDDSIVTTRVKSALLADAEVKSFDIAIATRKGQVQLSGYVDNQAQINRAIDVTRAVEGVQSINNEMSIKK
jgi:hyperosmotically inducible protein